VSSVDFALPQLPERELQLARSLTLRYVLTSTVILLAAGLLGVLLRFSQADVGRVHDTFWYETMTAHGLGAFLGWAGFAVMGFSWWILAWVGFPLRRLGAALASLTYWLMVAGVAGVLVSTLLMHFGGSWVFLYPLPFDAAGEWGRWATAVFCASVLLVGLSIVTWCVAILHTVVGPALHAVKGSVVNRLGVAMGFGYLWPRTFATNPQPVPYAVIPLAVIGIDMIIATLPLAVLLVEMIVQAFSPGVTVDPLLAKNVLWWFGHPVVYLLLFPAVSIFYFLVPRYAGRELVAGNVIAIAWIIAVVANVFVWAHHVYLDYPFKSNQGAFNTFAQPVTFALTIPSALSIYSLGFTIYRSRMRWNAVSLALFLALFSWLTAGLSGVINATIAFDSVVHNTLWIVGHFHHMALLNIGLVIFAGIYAFLPELTGKPLYSDALAKWHIALTFLFGTANSALWLVQGLQGAPRRYAVLPHEYTGLAKAALPLVGILAAAQLLFVWNVVQTLRGAGALSAAGRRRQLQTATAEAAIVLVSLGLAFVAAVAGFAIGRHTGRHVVKQLVTSKIGQATKPDAAGKQVFASAGCGNCHTLSAAGAHGNVGPNLDSLRLSPPKVEATVKAGPGAMPSFKGQLSEKQIKQVARFVSDSERVK
jgi:cytochrome c oxidase subunit I